MQIFILYVYVYYCPFTVTPAIKFMYILVYVYLLCMKKDYYYYNAFSLYNT